MIDFSQLFSPLSLPELQQAQSLLSHEMDKRREQERDRLFEEFAALARARGIAIHEVVRRTHGNAPPPKRGGPPNAFAGRHPLSSGIPTRKTSPGPGAARRPPGSMPR